MDFSDYLCVYSPPGLPAAQITFKHPMTGLCAELPMMRIKLYREEERPMLLLEPNFEPALLIVCYLLVASSTWWLR